MKKRIELRWFCSVCGKNAVFYGETIFEIFEAIEVHGWTYEVKTIKDFSIKCRKCFYKSGSTG